MAYYKNADGSYTDVPTGPDSVYVDGQGRSTSSQGPLRRTPSAGEEEILAAGRNIPTPPPAPRPQSLGRESIVLDNAAQLDPPLPDRMTVAGGAPESPIRGRADVKRIVDQNPETNSVGNFLRKVFPAPKDSTYTSSPSSSPSAADETYQLRGSDGKFYPVGGLELESISQRMNQPNSGGTSGIEGPPAPSAPPNYRDLLRRGVTTDEQRQTPIEGGTSRARNIIRAGLPGNTALDYGGQTIYGSESSPGSGLNTFVGVGTPRSDTTDANQLYDEAGNPLGARNGIGTTDLREAANAFRARAADLPNRRRQLRGGAAYNGNILGQINRINRAAQEEFNRVRSATNNSKAAARAADVIRSQADDLLGYDQNRVNQQGNQLRADSADYSTDAYRERTQADAQLAAASSNAASQQARDEAFDQYLTNRTSFLNEKTGKYEENPVLKARIQDMMGNYQGPNRTRVAQSLLGVANVLNNISDATNYDFADLTEVFDVREDGAVKIRGGKLMDIFNTAGYDLEDYISEWLPGGASGDVLMGIKNGRDVELSADLFDERLSPRANNFIYGLRGRRDQ